MQLDEREEMAVRLLAELHEQGVVKLNAHQINALANCWDMSPSDKAFSAILIRLRHIGAINPGWNYTTTKKPKMSRPFGVIVHPKALELRRDIDALALDEERRAKAYAEAIEALRPSLWDQIQKHWIVSLIAGLLLVLTALGGPLGIAEFGAWLGWWSSPSAETSPAQE